MVDQRNYPALILYELAYYLAPRPVPFASSTERDQRHPGRFLCQPADSVKASSPVAYPSRVVMLMNEKSRSLAEFTAMALRATPNCLLQGSQAAGSDGNASKIVLPGGLNTLIMGIGIYYPDRGGTQQVSLRLDVTLRPTVAGIRAGRGELRDRAVELTSHPSPPTN